MVKPYTQTDALESLRADHREVLRRLKALADLINDDRELARPSAVPELHGFLELITGEVWLHFHREEEVLFPLIARIFPAEGAPIKGGPVFVLTEEHSILRKLVARFTGYVQQWIDGVPGALDGLRLTGTQLIRAFEKHIYKEDNIVFRLAENALSETDRNDLTTAFHSVTA